MEKDIQKIISTLEIFEKKLSDLESVVVSIKSQLVETENKLSDINDQIQNIPQYSWKKVYICPDNSRYEYIDQFDMDKQGNLFDVS